LKAHRIRKRPIQEPENESWEDTGYRRSRRDIIISGRNLLSRFCCCRIDLNDRIHSNPKIEFKEAFEMSIGWGV
jgi:hypothetical protein